MSILCGNYRSDDPFLCDLSHSVLYPVIMFTSLLAMNHHICLLVHW